MRNLLLAIVVIAALSGAPILMTGCGGSASSDKKKKKRGRKRKPKKGAKADVDDPRIQPKVSSSDKALVLKLGALSAGHYEPGMEELRNLKTKAIVPLCWGMKYPLQNLRTRCVEILSEMRLHEDMIGGCLNSLRVYRTDVSDFEAPLRRWAMKVLARFHRFSVYTMAPVRRSLELDYDPGVRVIAGWALCLMGFGKDGGMPAMIAELRPIDWDALAGLVKVYKDKTNPDKVRINAMKDIEAFQKKNGLQGKSKVMLETHRGLRARYAEAAALAGEYIEKLGGPKAGASYDEVKKWWAGNKKTHSFPKVNFSNDPMPIKIPVKRWVRPDVQLLPMQLENIESDLREADELIGQGENRRAAGVLRRAFKESQNTDLDIFYKHFTAQCAIDFQGWKEAKEAFEMVLILDPDNETAQEGIKEMNQKLGK
jgi:hypothetical protein